LSSVPYKFARKTDDPQSDLLRYVVDNPLSRFSEAIRSLKVAVDFNSIVRENRLLAVTSTLPNEGKSTLSTNLAQLMAHGGARVILIDADLRNPSLSRELVPDAQAGLVDVVAQREQLENVLVIDPETKLAIL
ncbi:exopolysaccharide biosynthesis protein, partial [Escherichia coli]